MPCSNTQKTVAQANESLWRLVERRSSPIVAFNKSGTAPPFYFVHSISGDVQILGKLTQALGANQPLYGIQVPRNKMTARFATSIEAVARDYVQEVQAFQPEGPIILGGWSTGAIIALEMAQQFIAIGRDIPLLVAFDGAPANSGGGLSQWDPRYIWKLLRNAPRWLIDDQEESWSWRSFGKRLAERVDFKLQLMSPRIASESSMHGEAVEKLLSKQGWSSNQADFIQAMWDAQRAYVPKPYAGRVILYEAEVQPLLHLLQLPDAWAKIAQQFESVRLPGGHRSIFHEPGISIIAAHLLTSLAARPRQAPTRLLSPC